MAVLGYCFVVYLGMLAAGLDGKLSPFGHTPQVPVEEVKPLPVIVLTLIALVLVCIGFTGYNRRDIQE